MHPEQIENILLALRDAPLIYPQHSTNQKKFCKIFIALKRPQMKDQLVKVMKRHFPPTQVSYNIQSVYENE